MSLNHDYNDGSANKNTEVAEVATVAKKRKSKRASRTFKLYEYAGDRKPKNGGSYSGSPLQAALKCANRWVVPKNTFDTEFTFKLRETTKDSEKQVYPFRVKRMKLDKPKVYKRGDKEITVSSKIISC